MRRIKIWDAMAEGMIPKKLIRLTSAYVNESETAVIVGETISIFFAINSISTILKDRHRKHSMKSRHRPRLFHNPYPAEIRT